MSVDLHAETAGTVSTSSEQITILADGAAPVPSPTLKFVSIVALDRSIQIRAKRHERLRKRYATDMQDGAKFEPIDVFENAETGDMYRATGGCPVWARELNKKPMYGRTCALALQRSLLSDPIAVTSEIETQARLVADLGLTRLP